MFGYGSSWDLSGGDGQFVFAAWFAMAAIITTGIMESQYWLYLRWGLAIILPIIGILVAKTKHENKVFLAIILIFSGVGTVLLGTWFMFIVILFSLLLMYVAIFG